MEITAVLEALTTLGESAEPIEVVSDSTYVVNCFRDKWYVKWRRSG
jgi:ribonuclease HI